jgi:hypothetical protein
MSKGWNVTVAFLAVHLSLILYLYPENMISVAHFGHWAYILAGFALELILLRFYLAGLAAFPGEDLLGIVRKYGIWAARILLLPLTVYFFMSYVLLNRSTAEMVTVVFLPKTPVWALLLLLLGIPLQAALHGSKAILRGTFILMAVVMPLILLSLAACFQNTNLNFIFPMSVDLSFWRKDGFLTGLGAHSAFLFLGMTSANCDFSSARVRRMLYVAFGALLPFFFLAIYLPLMIYAPGTIAKFPYPRPSAMDTVNLEWLFFDRITMFYVVSSLAFIFIFTSILVWMIASMLAKLYVPFSNKVLCWAAAFIAYVCCLSIPDSETAQRLIKMDTLLRFYSIGFIPLLIYVIGMTKGRRIGS